MNPRFFDDTYYRYCDDLEHLVDVDFMMEQKCELIGEPDFFAV